MKKTFLPMAVAVALLVGEAVADDGATVFVPVENSQGMGVKVVWAGPTYSQTYHKVYTRSQTSDAGKAYIQFDLSDIWAAYGQANLISATLTLWGENGPSRSFTVSGLNDSAGLEDWDMATLSWLNAPGNDTASGTLFDLTKSSVLWTTSPGVNTYNLSLLDSNFDQCARYLSPAAASANILAFLQADTDGKVTFMWSGTNNQNWWCGIGGPESPYKDDVAKGYFSTAPETLGELCRQSPTLTLEFPPFGAKDPNPYPGSIVGTDLAQLSWTNPDPNDGVSAITPTVYFGTDPNRLQMDSITLAPGASSVAVNTSNFPTYGNLQNLTKYYWTVDCDDPSRVPLRIPGVMWNFLVNNNDPPYNVDAGDDQVVWNPNVTVNLAGSAEDDGLPTPPGALTYLWTQVSNGAPAVVISPDDAATTSVTLTERGTYEFKLAVNDGGIYPDVTDTVRIVVGDNACDASHIYTGDPYNTSDTNKDCIVDLADFVDLIANKWLDCTDTLTNCIE